MQFRCIKSVKNINKGDEVRFVKHTPTRESYTIVSKSYLLLRETSYPEYIEMFTQLTPEEWTSCFEPIFTKI